jgi:hypothetical protein
MATYKNDYSKQEDPMLWENHEIRHNLQEKFATMSVNQINKDAKAMLEEWKKLRSMQPQTK